MRVGSFVLMRDKKARAYEAIIFVPRLPNESAGPSRFEYERPERLGYMEHALQFLNQMRRPDDPEAVDILVKLWPDLRRMIENYVEELCIRELKESNNEPPTHPF